MHANCVEMREALTLQQEAEHLDHDHRVELEAVLGDGPRARALHLEDEDEDRGFVHVLCRKGTDEIVGATVCANRAGEIINEISLAIQAKVGLGTLARVIHPYPTTSEAVMQCGLQWIRARWKLM